MTTCFSQKRFVPYFYSWEIVHSSVAMNGTVVSIRFMATILTCSTDRMLVVVVGKSFSHTQIVSRSSTRPFDSHLFVTNR
mmetsp:Transcript_2567/g.6159  ORF Transcript_2567/g.6159 Transcript_2567/m.6159 type:complete len:80 (+) Transcript_2567:77-316(+)